MAKRLICVIISVLMIVSLLSVSVLVASADEVTTIPSTLSANTKYKLTNDVSVSGGITSSAEGVVIDLNGHTLTADITVSGGSLEIKDSTATETNVAGVGGSVKGSITITSAADTNVLTINGGNYTSLSGNAKTATVNYGTFTTKITGGVLGDTVEGDFNVYSNANGTFFYTTTMYHFSVTISDTTTYYTDLNTALTSANVNGQTATLTALNNLDASGDTNFSITSAIDVVGNLTIDFNNCSTVSVSVSSEYIFKVSSGASLTLLNNETSALGSSSATSTSNGGIGVYVDGGTLTLGNGCKLAGYYGVKVENSGTVTVRCGATVIGANTGIYADNSTVNVYGDVVGSTYGIYATGSTVNVSSGTVNYSSSGTYGIYADNSSVNVTGTDASVDGTTYGIYATNSSTISNTSGAMIGYYRNPTYGIYAENSTVSAVYYSKGSQYGVYLKSSTLTIDGTFEMIEGSSSAIYADASTVTITNAGVSEVASTSYCLQATNSSSVTINSGWFNGSTSACLSGDTTSTISVSGGKFSSDVTTYCSSGYASEYNSETGEYVITESDVDYVASVTSSTDSSVTNYESVSAAIEAADEGDTVTLLKSVSEDVTIDYTKSLTLDLAGYTLTGSITITGGDLTLDDSSEEGTGTVTGGVTVNAKVVFEDTTVFLLDGKLHDSWEEGSKDYAGLGLAGTGSFTMYGGTIKGGVTVSNNSSFTMTGGTISTNTSGRGVYLSAAAVTGDVFTVTFDDSGTISNITKVTVSDNLANYFTMSGGTITDCSTTGYGGGVYVGLNCVFTMDDGTITGNAAAVGGGVYLNDGSTFTMTAGAIYGNTATSYAADIFNTSGGTATIIAASSMTGCDGYAWYSDGNGARYTDEIVLVTDTSFVQTETSLIAVRAVETPTLYGRTLTLDGAVGVTFYIDMGDLNPDDYTMTANIGTSRTISGITYTNTKTIGDTTYYRYTVYVNATEYNQDITATLYCGTAKVDTYTYSVATYCTKAINQNWDEAELCKALMVYGNYAEGYFADGYGTYTITWDDPVSSWDSELSGVSATATESGYKPSSIGDITASLNLSTTNSNGQWLSSGAISMNFYVTAESGIEGITFKINGEDVNATETSKTNVYCVSVQIPASKMSSTDYTLSISDGTDTFTVTYSVYQYIAYTLEETTDSTVNEVVLELKNRQNLVKAMYYFSEAAASYSNWY